MLTREEIAGFRQEVAALRRRRANVKRPEIESLAVRMGWASRPTTGGEPRYQKSERYPLFIPAHRSLKPYTIVSILRQLDDDLDLEEEAHA
jgi:hypothetical protein